ncbi:MAG: DUF4290 domain-containing protein [Flavobacteriales bacterium]|nr:DUF4290 domain-containing protein [Flavobacteriales bacterium]PIE87338.1 MAG: hypothetical protein CSA03_00855 [Bacteroidota bacterium]
MEYNTARGKLLLPEYGRNVQNMIQHAMEIEDREERNRAARAIIEVMGQLNPHLRDVDDYRHKLWTHLFVMSDFKLDVDSPFEIPEMESLQEKPQKVEYPKSKIRFGHFGQYTQKILEKSKSLEDEGEREYMTNAMANFMKKQYLLHNNSAVENNVIADQLMELSQGDLKIENPDDLVSTNLLLKELGLKQSARNQKNQKNNKNNRRSNSRKKKSNHRSK